MSRNFLKKCPLVFQITSSRCYHHHLRMSRLFPVNAGQGQMPVTGEKCQSQKLLFGHGVVQGAASAGTLNMLPAATRALEKLYRLIDHEMSAIGAQKVALPCLAHSRPWKQSGRWADMGEELLQLKDRHGNLHCLAPTHEEAITQLVAAFSPLSHRWLPVKLYQIGRKFRDEKRPKNGLLRTREFEMKDLYSFDRDLPSAQITYEEVCTAYSQLFQKLGLDYIKAMGAVGAMGGVLSHEFHLLADAGEDRLMICRNCHSDFNQETLDANESPVQHCRTCSSPLEEVSGMEVAHAFLLGSKYSTIFKAQYIDEQNQKKDLEMGCYGIGVTRLLAAAVEVLSSEECIRWPRLIAPYTISIIPQKEGYRFDDTMHIAENLQKSLSQHPFLRSEVVLDDRSKLSIGRRLRHASSAGYPWAVVVGKQALDSPSQLEVVDIYNDKKEYLSMDQTVDRLTKLETVTLP